MKARATNRNDRPSAPQFLTGSTDGCFSSSEITSMFGSIKVENEPKQDNADNAANVDNDDKTESAQDGYLSLVKNCATITADFVQITKFKAQYRLESIAESYVKYLFVASY
ncbi:MAG: hypothetical protein ACXVAY_17290 [Mucilaginibacter sp.]